MKQTACLHTPPFRLTKYFITHNSSESGLRGPSRRLISSAQHSTTALHCAEGVIIGGCEGGRCRHRALAESAHVLIARDATLLGWVRRTSSETRSAARLLRPAHLLAERCTRLGAQVCLQGTCVFAGSPQSPSQIEHLCHMVKVQIPRRPVVHLTCHDDGRDSSSTRPVISYFVHDGP